MEVIAVLRQAHEVGLVVWVDGDDLQVEGFPSPEAMEVLDDLREHKAEVLDCLRKRTELIELPWPIGYGGLPVGQVEAALAIMNKMDVIDPILRKYNVVAWVRGFYQDRGENHGEHYDELVAEQLRLGGILDPTRYP